MYLTAAAAKDSFIYAPSITRKKPIEYSLDKAIIGSDESIAEKKKNEAHTSDNKGFYVNVDRLAKASEEEIAQAKSDFSYMYVTSAARKYYEEELQELLAERNAAAANPVSVCAPVGTAKPTLRITALENRASTGAAYDKEDTEELLKKLIEAWISIDDEEEKRRRKIRPKSADDKFMNMVLMRDEKMKGIKRARNTVLKIEQDQFDDIFKHLEDNTNPETTEIKIETEAKTAAQTEKEAEAEAEAQENVGDQAS